MSARIVETDPLLPPVNGPTSPICQLTSPWQDHLMHLNGNGTLEQVPFFSTQAFVMSTDSICGTAELPLPNGERVGVRGNQPLDRNPLTPPLSPAGRGSLA